jgi:hypothetical protein
MRSVPAPMLDLWIDAVIDDDPLSKARSNVDALASLARAGAGLARLIRKQRSDEAVEDSDGDRSWPRLVATDLTHAVLADIHPDARQYLESVARARPLASVDSVASRFPLFLKRSRGATS